MNSLFYVVLIILTLTSLFVRYHRTFDCVSYYFIHRKSNGVFLSPSS